MSGGLTTGELAKRGGVNLESIREGLLPKPPRTRSGYRLFSDDSVRRIRLIKRAQELGFSLREVKELSELRFDPSTSCREVRERSLAKLADVEQKIRDLQRTKRTLVDLTTACPGHGNTGDCPILKSLSSTEPSPSSIRECLSDAPPSAPPLAAAAAAPATAVTRGQAGQQVGYLRRCPVPGAAPAAAGQPSSAP